MEGVARVLPEVLANLLLAETFFQAVFAEAESWRGVFLDMRGSDSIRQVGLALLDNEAGIISALREKKLGLVFSPTETTPVRACRFSLEGKTGSFVLAHLLFVRSGVAAQFWSLYRDKRGNPSEAPSQHFLKRILGPYEGELINQAGLIADSRQRGVKFASPEQLEAYVSECFPWAKLSFLDFKGNDWANF